MDRRAVVRSYLKWTGIGSVLGMCVGTVLSMVFFYFMRRYRVGLLAETIVLRLFSWPVLTTVGALAASVQFGRKYRLSNGFHIRSVAFSILGLAIAYGLLFQMTYGLLMQLNKIPVVRYLIAASVLPGVLAVQFALSQGKEEYGSSTLPPRDISLPPWVASVLATISAMLGLLNPRLVEYVLWQAGNPLPFGTETFFPSVLFAVLSAVTGTVAVIMIERPKRKSSFKYAALVGAGISYPFLVYYTIRAFALFYGLSQIH